MTLLAQDSRMSVILSVTIIPWHHLDIWWSVLVKLKVCFWTIIKDDPLVISTPHNQDKWGRNGWSELIQMWSLIFLLIIDSTCFKITALLAFPIDSTGKLKLCISISYVGIITYVNKSRSRKLTWTHIN